MPSELEKDVDLPYEFDGQSALGRIKSMSKGHLLVDSCITNAHIGISIFKFSNHAGDSERVLESIFAFIDSLPKINQIEAYVRYIDGERGLRREFSIVADLEFDF